MDPPTTSAQRTPLGHVSSNQAVLADALSKVTIQDGIAKPVENAGTDTHGLQDASILAAQPEPSAVPAKIWLKLTLISPTEFTILASTHERDDPTSDCSIIETLRADIERIASSHGGAIYEQPDTADDEGELLGTSRWKIPLSSYDLLLTFLKNRANVDGIPNEHLLATELHYKDQGIEPAFLVEEGIPEHVASSLAGYQREGVAFVLSRNGRALVADEMGLGKTFQSLAAMCAYVQEWPLLVISPSSARYNWKAECLQWLGREQGRSEHPTSIDEDDIQVLENGKECISKTAKIVICSYGLLTIQIAKKRIKDDTFKCIIVDESHMLKNMKAKRTIAAVPVLKEATRIILLSGTPAFKNPQELYPQLKIIGGSELWEDEQQYKEEYCYKSASGVGGRNLYQLHALLLATIMIRRKKMDVLADALPEKKRELSHITVTDTTAREQLDAYMKMLRDTKGSLGETARALQDKCAAQTFTEDEEGDDDMIALNDALERIALNDDDKDFTEMTGFLPKLFELTGRVKVPVVVSQLKAWLNENKEGKIIVFAHHRAVLNKIEESIESVKKIRIDGTTDPKKRQSHVQAFQNDPAVRVALLSTTAAGVAITLTASSTVWFAELFWTPGLLIQAEDRCHRIGQKKGVDVFYFVAKDTLDDVLWRLAVRKFIAVGEMIDGSSKTIDVHDYDDAALLDVTLDLESFYANNSDDESLDDFIVNDDEDLGWGTAAKVAELSPVKSDEEFAPFGKGRSAPKCGCYSESESSLDEKGSFASEVSSLGESFDSDCLTDDDQIENEEEEEESESDDSDYL